MSDFNFYNEKKKIRKFFWLLTSRFFKTFFFLSISILSEKKYWIRATKIEWRLDDNRGIWIEWDAFVTCISINEFTQSGMAYIQLIFIEHSPQAIDVIQSNKQLNSREVHCEHLISQYKTIKRREYKAQLAIWQLSLFVWYDEFYNK